MAEQTVAELILKILAEADEFKETLKDAKKENAKFTEKLVKDSEGATKKIVSAFKKVFEIVKKVHETLKLTAKTLYNFSFKIFAKAVAPIAVFVAAMAAVRDESFRVATMFRSVARSMKIFAREASEVAIPIAEWFAEKLAILAHWVEMNGKHFRGFARVILYIRTTFLGLIGTITFLGGVFFSVFAWLFKRAVIILILWVTKLMLLRFFNIGLWTALWIAVKLLTKAFFHLAVYALKPLMFVLAKLVVLVWSLLTPVGLIIAAVILLGVVWYKNWFGMRDIVRKVAEFVGKVMGFVVNMLISRIIFMGELWAIIWTAAKKIILEVFDKIKEIVGKAFDWIGKKLTVLYSLWITVWSNMREVVIKIVDSVRKITDKMMESILRMIEFSRLIIAGKKIGVAWKEAGKNAKEMMTILKVGSKYVIDKLKELTPKAVMKAYVEKLKEGVDKAKALAKVVMDIIKNTSRTDIGKDWGKRFPEIMKEIEEFADTLGPKLNALFNRLFAPKPKIPQWITDFVKGWQDGIERATKGWDQFGAHIMNVAESTATGMKNVFADVFVDGFNGQLKKASEYFLAFRNIVLRAIAEMIAKMITFSILRNTASSFTPFSRFFGGITKHLGGMIKKAHEGLALDEVPIVAQTGEAILSRQGVAGLGGPPAVEALNAGGGLDRGAASKTVNIYAMDADSFGDYVKKNKGSIGEAMMDSADENSSIRRL